MKLDKLGMELVDEFLGVLNRQFYFDGPKKAFFWDRSLLIDAIQHPAVYLHDRGIHCEFPVERYRELLMGIIAEIKRHGDTDKIQHFGRYFYKCVQDHMRHQGDRYYAEAVAARNSIANIAAGLLSKRKQPTIDPTVEILATAAKLAAQRRGKKKAKVVPAPEPDLFASMAPATPLQASSRRPA